MTEPFFFFLIFLNQMLNFDTTHDVCNQTFSSVDVCIDEEGEKRKRYRAQGDNHFTWLWVQTPHTITTPLSNNKHTIPSNFLS